MPFSKGNPGGPGRPRRESRPPTVLYDIKQAARAHCERSIEVLAEALEHKDVRVRMVAAIALIERAYGKPAHQTDSAVNHKFAVAVLPETMEKSEWLERRGQPRPRLLPPPDDDPERSSGG